MKKVTFLLLVLMKASFVDAAEIIIRTFNHQNMMVSLDQMAFTPSHFQHSFSGVRPGFHLLEIRLIRHYKHGYYSKIITEQIFVHSHVKMFIIVDPDYRLNITEVNLKNHPDRNFRYPDYSDRNEYYPHNYEEQESSFQLLIHELRHEPFDANKIKLLEHAFRYGRFTSLQINEILKTFTFDSFRLDAAKMGWHSVVDPQNYYMVYRTFTFKCNADELMEYISRN